MSVSSIISSKAVRNIRKIERPRPLRQDSKRSSSANDDLISDLESLNSYLNNLSFEDSVFDQIQLCCTLLKAYGAQFESKFKDHLDRYFVSFRNASRDDRLDRLSRLRFLEVIELRAMGWKQNEEINKYYQNKYVELENILERGPSPNVNIAIQQSPSNQNIPISLNGSEILKTSGKFSRATRIPGKNYFKDEIVIRNSDSGKVAQGVKERLVQITGPHEEAIGSAKNLIEDTIRRNASPVMSGRIAKSLSSSSINSNASDDSGTSISNGHDVSGDASNINDYHYTVKVCGDTIRLSGSNVDRVRTAKLVLEEYFAGQEESSSYSYSGHSIGDARNSRRPLSMLANLDSMPSLNNNRSYSSNGSFENKTQTNGDRNVLPLQRSKSIPVNRTSSASRNFQTPTMEEDSDETTYLKNKDIIGESIMPKGLNRSSSVSDKDNIKSVHKKCQEEQRTWFRSASLRMARFAQNEDGDSSNRYATDESDRITYNRVFLLDCAKSPFSTHVPRGLTNIIQELPYLLKKTPEMFDPEAYKTKNIVCVPYTRNSDAFERYPSLISDDGEDENVFLVEK